MEQINPEDIPDEDLDRVFLELTSLQSTTPLDYEPHEKQLKFHTSLKRIRLFSGGNRSGKTEAGTLEALYHATGLYPVWYPKEARIDRPNKGRIVVEDYAKGCGEVLEPKIMKWLPKDLIVHIRRTLKGFVEKIEIRHVSGGVSSFDVMTHEQDDGVFEGWSGDWSWFDEPPPKEKWIATKRGLVDFHGRAWFTLTPIKEPWIHEEFVLSGDEDVEHIEVDMRQNPHISEADIVFFEKNLSEDDKEARIHGKFKYLSGRIYKELVEAIHCVPEKLITLDKRWPIFFVLDPADRRPHRGIWATVDPFGTIYIFEEIEFTGTVKQLAKEIFLRERSMGINPMTVIRLGDPNKFKAPSALSEEVGATMLSEFSNHGLYFIVTINDDIASGHLIVKSRLMWDKSQPISSTNHPKLFFIKEDTKKCVKQMLTYVWDDYKGASKDSKDLKEKPKDINKDYPDCIRYLCVFNPQFYIQDQNDPRVEKSSSFTGYR